MIFRDSQLPKSPRPGGPHDSADIERGVGRHRTRGLFEPTQLLQDNICVTFGLVNASTLTILASNNLTQIKFDYPAEPRIASCICLGKPLGGINAAEICSARNLGP